MRAGESSSSWRSLMTDAVSVAMMEGCVREDHQALYDRVDTRRVVLGIEFGFTRDK